MRRSYFTPLYEIGYRSEIFTCAEKVYEQVCQNGPGSRRCFFRYYMRKRWGGIQIPNTPRPGVFGPSCILCANCCVIVLTSLMSVFRGAAGFCLPDDVSQRRHMFRRQVCLQKRLQGGLLQWTWVSHNFLSLRPGGGLLRAPLPSFFQMRTAVFGTAYHASFPHMLYEFQTQVTQGQVTWSRQVTSPHKKFECSSKLHGLNDCLETFRDW